MTQKLIRIVALVGIDANSEDDVRTIGGNIARTMQANIPAPYDVKGVELESVTDVEDEPPASLRDADKDTNTRAKRQAAAEEENKPTLKT